MTQSTQQEIITKLDNISDNISDMKTDIAVIKSKLEGQQKAVEKIPDLAEKVGELKNWKQIGLILTTAIISTVFGWILRSGKF